MQTIKRIYNSAAELKEKRKLANTKTAAWTERTQHVHVRFMRGVLRASCSSRKCSVQWDVCCWIQSSLVYPYTPADIAVIHLNISFPMATLFHSERREPDSSCHRVGGGSQHRRRVSWSHRYIRRTGEMCLFKPASTFEDEVLSHLDFLLQLTKRSVKQYDETKPF